MHLISSEYLESFELGCETNWDEVSLKLSSHAQTPFNVLEDLIKDAAYYSTLIEDSGNNNSLSTQESHFSDLPFSKEMADLKDSYCYAMANPLTKKNFLRAFEILSSTLLPEKLHGSYRVLNHQTSEENGTSIPLYVAIEPENVEKTFNQFFEDINELLNQNLSTREVFYYASVIHLWLAKIHPFPSANGQSARLLEKWFIASKLGNCAWCIESEKYYYESISAYRQNLSLGFNFYALFWERCIPFLLMLPDAFENSSENKSNRFN